VTKVKIDGAKEGCDSPTDLSIVILLTLFLLLQRENKVLI
jgi:hypothetical protein